VTQPASHIDDDVLSAFVDQQLSTDDLARARAHLETCADCQERLDGFRSVATLLRQLPEVEPPRDFALGLRLVGEPPNVVRLRRWYAAARITAAGLAAVFVCLLAGTLYLSAQPAAPAASVARPQTLSAPVAATPNPAVAARSQAAAPQPQAAQQPQAVPPSQTGSSQVGSAQPQAAQPQPADGVAAAPHPATLSAQSDDQVAAATSVSPLPTPPPTPVPTAVAAPVAAAVATAESAPGAPLGLGALGIGVLAIVALLIALVARHRLQRASTV
jgi:hypothetical protein